MGICFCVDAACLELIGRLFSDSGPGLAVAALWESDAVAAGTEIATPPVPIVLLSLDFTGSAVPKKPGGLGGEPSAEKVKDMVPITSVQTKGFWIASRGKQHGCW